MDNKNFNDAIKNLNEHLQPNKDKRRNQIEKCQIDILNILLEEGWSKTFENYRFDLRTSKKRSDQYNLHDDGMILMANGKRNKLHSSASFDACLNIIDNNGRMVRLWFVMKGVYEGGGHQDGVYNEIARYISYIEKNNNVDDKIVFLLDGPYYKNINEEIKDEAKKSDKYIFSNSLTVEKDIENLIYKNL